MVDSIERAAVGGGVGHSQSDFYCVENQKNRSAHAAIISTINSPCEKSRRQIMAGSTGAQSMTLPDEQILRALRAAISEATLRPEPEAIAELRVALEPVEQRLESAKSRAIDWVEAARR